MRASPKFILGAVIALLLAWTAGYAANPEGVVVRQNPTKPWKAGDQICSKDKNNQTHCGTVLRAGKKAVLLQLLVKGQGVDIMSGESTTGAATAKPTDSALPIREKKNRGKKRKFEPAKESHLSTPNVAPPAQAPTKAERRPTSQLTTTAQMKPSNWNLAAGLTAGLNFLFPMLHFQHRVGPKISVGLMPFFSKGTSVTNTVTALGAFFTTSYHFTGPGYSGPLAQGGLGYYSIDFDDGAQTVRGSSAAITLVGGYRYVSALGLSVMGGAGAQFASRISGDPSKVDFSGLRLIATVELGYSF